MTRKQPQLFRSVLVGVLSMLALAAAVTAADTDPQAHLGKLITLHLHAAPAKDAIAELQKQSGIIINAGSAAAVKLNSARVNVDADNQPFWTVLASIIDSLNLRPQEFKSNPPSITLTGFAPSWKPPYFTVSGPVAIALVQIRRTATINYGSEEAPAPTHYGLTFELYPEPWMKIAEVVSIDVSRCVDDTGFPITVTNVRTVGQTGFPRSEVIQLFPQGGKKIAELEGKVVFRMAQGQHHLEIQDPLKIKEAALPVDVPGARIVSCVKESQRQYVMAVLLPHGADGQPVGQTILESISENRPRLIDSTGHVFSALRMEPKVDVNDDTTITFTLIAGGGSLPSEVTSLLWDVSTGIRDVGYPFTFQNVPLPKMSPPSQITSVRPGHPTAVLSAPAPEAPPDYAKQINELIAKLSSTTTEDRLCGRIGLAMLPPAALPALDAAANRKDLPPYATSSLVAIRAKQRSWQQARAKRDAINAEVNAWQEKLALDTYNRLGRRDPRWDQKAVDAIRAYFNWTERTDIPRVRTAFEDALAAGCEDPLVLGFAAHSFETGGADLDTIYSLYAKARDGMARQHYPAVFQFWNSSRYYALAYAVGNSEAQGKKQKFYSRRESGILEKMPGDIAMLWPQAAHDGMPPKLLVDTAQRAMLLRVAKRNNPEDIDAAILAPLQAAKASDSLMLRLKGLNLINAAWEARGSDTIDKVSPAGFKLFMERLGRAETALTRSYQLDPSDPATSAEMITLCMGRQHPRPVMEGWYNKAMAADPTYMDAVDNKLEYLRPMWYGSFEEMQQFGDECYKSENWRAGLPFIKAAKHNRLVVGLDKPEEYFALEPVFMEIKSVFEPYLKAEPDDIDRRAKYCEYACQAGRWKEAAEQFKLLGSYLPIRYFGYPDRLKEWQAKAASGGNPGKL